MDMNAPFYKLGLFNDNVSLIFAFIIGIAFGFFLERGGLGNSRKLAAQFYLTDLTVFKVMFTAIVTAMLGLFWFSWIGFVDLSLVLCPGTACVASATGKIDGVVLLVGIFFGIFLFGELFHLFYEFLYTTSLGQVTFSQMLDIPYGLAVFVIVFLALAGFAGAGVIEKKFASKH
jgi:hypothetical protein